MRIFIIAFCFASMAALLGCGPDEEPRDVCSDYCDAEETCQEESSQMFSQTECRYDCDVALERHESLGCGDQMIDLFDCLIDLECNQWGAYGSMCAAEIDYLDICVGVSD